MGGLCLAYPCACEGGPHRFNDQKGLGKPAPLPPWRLTRTLSSFSQLQELVASTRLGTYYNSSSIYSFG